MAVLVVSGAFGVIWLLLWLLSLVHPLLSVVAEIWLISTTIAARGLAAAAGEIYLLLVAGNLTGARAKVAWIVGRDTAHMEPAEVTRATVETVAETQLTGWWHPCFIP